MGRPEEESSDLYNHDNVDTSSATESAAAYYEISNDQQQRPQQQPPPYGQPQNPPPPALYQQQPPPYGQPQNPPPPALYQQQPPPPRLAQFPPQTNPPPPESYPPQKPPPPVAYPQHGPLPPAAYPPRSPLQQPAAYPPPQQFPPQGGPQPQYGQANYQQQPVQYPPPQPNVSYGQVPHSQMKPPTGIPVGMGMGPAVNTEGWRTGLFDCLDDPMNAVITLLFPCLTFGQIAEIVDNGQTSCGTGAVLYALIASFIGVPCIYSCTYRTKLRSKFGLVEAPAPDWLVHFVCEPCALCQAYRELNHRGLDPAIGWMGNVARNQQQPQMMMPPQNQTMMH